MLLAEPLRQHVSAIDKGQPLSDVKTMDDVVGTTLMRDRLSAGLLGVFAGFALLLAAIGVYGVIAYSVAQRTQEIGVRLALGADAVGILRLVLGQTMGLVVGGLVVGLMASMAAAPLLQSLLYEISPRDPLTWIVVTTVLTLTAAAAAISPAFRAVRIHPAVALRAE